MKDLNINDNTLLQEYTMINPDDTSSFLEVLKIIKLRIHNAAEIVNNTQQPGVVNSKFETYYYYYTINLLLNLLLLLLLLHN